jgi:hypothetical protein
VRLPHIDPWYRADQDGLRSRGFLVAPGRAQHECRL